MSDHQTHPIKIRGLHEAMERIKQEDPDMLWRSDLHQCLSYLRQAEYELKRGNVIAYKQAAFAERLIAPVLEFLENLDEA